MKGCHNKVLQVGWLRQRLFLFSPFWKPELCQGISSFASAEASLFALPSPPCAPSLPPCVHTSIASGCPRVFVWGCWSDKMRAHPNRAALAFPFRIPVKASMNLWLWQTNFGRHSSFHDTEWGQKASDPLFWDYMFLCHAKLSQDLWQHQYNAFKIKIAVVQVLYCLISSLLQDDWSSVNPCMASSLPEVLSYPFYL